MNAYDALVDDGVNPTPLRNLIGLPANQLHRVLKQIEVKPSGCWEWVGGISPRGYGRIYVGTIGKSQLQAHRLVYLLSVGPVPDSLDLHHRVTCKKCCVNPQHVKPLEHSVHSSVTHAGAERPKATRCANGHEFTPENTITYKKKRRCKTCDRQRRNQRYRASHPRRVLIVECKHGHALTPSNTYLYQKYGREYRACRICRMISVYKYQSKA